MLELKKKPKKIIKIVRHHNFPGLIVVFSCKENEQIREKFVEELKFNLELRGYANLKSFKLVTEKKGEYRIYIEPLVYRSNLEDDLKKSLVNALTAAK
jgi:hypothetical protein